MYKLKDYWINLDHLTHTIRHDAQGILIGFVGGSFHIEQFDSPEEADHAFFQLLDGLGVGCEYLGHDPVKTMRLGGELGAEFYICSRCRERVEP